MHTTVNKRLRTFTEYCGRECPGHPPPKGQGTLLCTLFSCEQATVQLHTSRRAVVTLVSLRLLSECQPQNKGRGMGDSRKPCIG